jgi:hypothetical protein
MCGCGKGLASGPPLLVIIRVGNAIVMFDNLGHFSQQRKSFVKALGRGNHALLPLLGSQRTRMTVFVIVK